MNGFDAMFGPGPIPVEPSSDQRDAARQLASWFTALCAAGFSERHALSLVRASLEGAASGQAQAAALLEWQEKHGG